MDKTPAQIINELVDNYEIIDSLDILDLCERVWDAAIAHVRPLIEAEARAAALEDAAQAAVASDSVNWALLAENLAAERIRALASAPPGHVCVPVTEVKALLANLAAAISLLQSTPKSAKAAPSDKMFGQMLLDYESALERGRTMLAARTE